MLSCALFFFFPRCGPHRDLHSFPHDALPISTMQPSACRTPWALTWRSESRLLSSLSGSSPRSEEHTSELQSQSNLVCRLLLEKKKTHTHAINQPHPHTYIPLLSPETHEHTSA